VRKPTCHLAFVAAAIAFVLGSASAAHATSISYFGSFAEDDDHFEVSFTVAASAQVFLQTWSYAGGTTPNGEVVPDGGFAAVLSLFGPINAALDPNDPLLVFDAGGTAPLDCGPRGIAGTGFCLDAFLSPILGPGTYLLVLTQSDNTPDFVYGDGFLHDGEGDYTPATFINPTGALSFIDPSGNPRTNAFALSITMPSADPVPAIPEPATLLTLATGSVLGALRRRRMRRSRSNSPETIQ
jgi:hypothetical protein